MKPIFNSAFIGVVVLLSGCYNDRWEGFVYPNKNDLSEHIGLGTFSTLEECRRSATDALGNLNPKIIGDYECGLNCETRSSMGGLKVCERTEK